MNRLLQALAALLMVALAAAPALGAPSVSGTLTPDASGYAYLIGSEAIDAQNGPDVIVKGTIGNLPADANYWVEIGLIPKAVRDELIAGTITSLWDEGVYLLSAMDSGGVFSVSAEDYEAQVGAPARSPVANDGSIAFKLTCKPTLGRMGGSATLRIDGAKTNMGKDFAVYGKRLATDASKTEDYTAAYLVAQVHTTTPGAGGVAVTAKAIQLKDAVRVTKILTYDAAMTERDTFSPGEVVTVQTRYKVLSTRTKLIQYEVRGEVKLLGTTQGVSENRRTGRYGFNKSFLIPANTNPGTYRVQVKLQLIRHLTDHYTNEPYEEILYTEEVFDKITVQ